MIRINQRGLSLSTAGRRQAQASLGHSLTRDIFSMKKNHKHVFRIRIIGPGTAVFSAAGLCYVNKPHRMQCNEGEF